MWPCYQAFQKGSSLANDMSIAIEALAQNGQLQSLHDLWLHVRVPSSFPRLPPLSLPFSLSPPFPPSLPRFLPPTQLPSHPSFLSLAPFHLLLYPSPSDPSYPFSALSPLDSPLLPLLSPLSPPLPSQGRGTCSSGPSLQSIRLGPDSFWGLFLLYVVAACGACLLYVVLLVYRGLKAFQHARHGHAEDSDEHTNPIAPMPKPKRLKSHVRHYKSAYTAGVEWSMQRNMGYSTRTPAGVLSSNDLSKYDVSSIDFSAQHSSGDTSHREEIEGENVGVIAPGHQDSVKGDLDRQLSDLRVSRFQPLEQSS
ncbi:unnamed protein product [Closterium sp. NIES-53]